MGTALRQDSRWQSRALIFLVLFIPLYVVPTCLRLILYGRITWWVGILLAGAIGSVAAGFLANNQRVSVLVYICSTALELILVASGRNPMFSLALGDLVPAVVTIYFAQQLFINMGD